MVVQSGVTHIGWYAFYACPSLASVTIGNSVQTIGDFAFLNCLSLASITVDGNNTAYSSEDGVLFNKAKTKLIQYPVGNTRASYAVPGTVKTIGDDAFYNCTSLASVTIPDSVTSIGTWAFSGCPALVNIFFLTTTWNITTIGSDAFSLGTSSASVNATVHSPNNIANGQLDAYKGSYTTLTYVASVAHTYTINVNDATYGSVSPASVQIYDGTSVVTDGNRLVFTDGQTVTATPAQST